jgi:hypothetical protein
MEPMASNGVLEPFAGSGMMFLRARETYPIAPLGSENTLWYLEAKAEI